MATEEQYDEIIAPMLLEVARSCEELGMSFLARVEWEPDEGGITQVTQTNASITHKLAQLGLHARGNLDLLVMNAMRKYDVGQTVVGRLMKGND